MPAEHEAAGSIPARRIPLIIAADFEFSGSAWAKREGETVEAKAQLPKLPTKLVEVVSREEIQRMEDAARTERDKLMVRVLADTGLRVDELLGLRTTDLVEQNRNYYLRVRGKGAKDRLVPAPRLYRRLRIYVERG